MRLIQMPTGVRRRARRSSTVPRVTRPSPAERRRRLRLVGWLVLAAGLFGAGLTYWVRTRHAEPSLDDLLPGSTLARRRQMGILYGTIGLMALEWGEDVKRPDTQAVLIVAACALIAVVCFRVADHETAHDHQDDE
jgi:hypothetical protein